jgi:predicted SprT family Zn-dependent metalloprotease
MDLNKAEKLAEDLMQEHGLYANPYLQWCFEFDNAKRRFGCCQYLRRVISLSKVLTELNSEAEVRDTILHEIAHALVGNSHGHDWVWKQKALEIGCNGNRCYSSKEVKTPESKYIAICHNCNHVHKKHKKPRIGLRQSCGVCNTTGKFNTNLLLTWVLREKELAF